MFVMFLFSSCCQLSSYSFVSRGRVLYIRVIFVAYLSLFMGHSTVLFTSVAGQSEVGSWTNVRARSDRGPGVGRRCVGACARASTPRSLPRHVQFMRRDKLCFPPFATGIRSFINSPHVIFIFLLYSMCSQSGNLISFW